MKKEGLELSNKQLKNLLIIGVMIFGIFLFLKSFIIDTDKKRYSDGLKNIKEENFNGVVVNKAFDKYNHNAGMIYLKDGTKFSPFGQFWSKIEIGDSVVKKKGETIITVFRKNRMYKLDNKEILQSFKR